MLPGAAVTGTAVDPPKTTERETIESTPTKTPLSFQCEFV